MGHEYVKDYNTNNHSFDINSVPFLMSFLRWRLRDVGNHIINECKRLHALQVGWINLYGIEGEGEGVNRVENRRVVGVIDSLDLTQLSILDQLILKYHLLRRYLAWLLKSSHLLRGFIVERGSKKVITGFILATNGLVLLIGRA